MIRVVDSDGDEQKVSLPDLLQMLVADRVASFPALRPHHRHAWHAFLVQLAVIALQRTGRNEVAQGAEEWKGCVRALTAEWPDDEPWSLVAPIEQPAFMQPPVWQGNLEAFSRSVTTPDTLDMLVATKNHDIKSHVLYAAQPDDWLFALVTLQTMQGFSGRKNFGIARMNGGFSNRPGIALEPYGGMGMRFVYEVDMLLTHWENFSQPNDEMYPDGERGEALLWLKQWDGKESLETQDAAPVVHRGVSPSTTGK